MTCKDCVHYQACKGTYYTAKGDESILYEFDGEMYAESGCEEFKNKADVVEVKHGEWVKFSLGEHDYVDRYKCSLCENIVLPYPNNIDSYLYCPKCGAKMNLKVGEK